MVRHETFCCIPKEARRDILAVIESAEVAADVGRGISLTTTEMSYHFHQTGKGSFPPETLIDTIGRG
ncbi:MAG: hypothetical protein R3C49_02395 [Planctomycetaceae bacterium]